MSQESYRRGWEECAAAVRPLLVGLYAAPRLSHELVYGEMARALRAVESPEGAATLRAEEAQE